MYAVLEVRVVYSGDRCFGLCIVAVPLRGREATAFIYTFFVRDRFAVATIHNAVQIIQNM